MRDLAHVLGAAVDARAAALDGLLPADGVPALRARVRRRRNVRHAAEAVAVLPVVAALGIGGWLLLGGRDPVPPVVTPTPDVTTPAPTATPSPTVTPPEPEALAEPGTVTVDPLLPTALPLPPGMLADPPEGSVLVTYSTDPGGVVVEGRHRVIWLVTPAGERFQVLEVPLELAVVGWQPGSTVAVVSMCCDASVGLLDLATGETTTTGWQEGFVDVVGTGLLLGVNPDGEHVWAAGSPQDPWTITAIVAGAPDLTTRSVPVTPAPVSRAALSPDGRRVVLNQAVLEGFRTTSYGPARIVDLESGDETAMLDGEGRPLLCSEVGWRDDRTATCTARDFSGITTAQPVPTDSDRLITVDVLTGRATVVADWAGLGFQLSDVVAVDGGYAAIAVPYIVGDGPGGTGGAIDPTSASVVFLGADGSVTHLVDGGTSGGPGRPGMRVLGVVDSRVLVQAPAGQGPAPLVLVDARTGAVTELVPPSSNGIQAVALG